MRLLFEDIDRYDTAWYADAAVRAVESILSPVGWREPQIRVQLADQVDTTLAAY